MHANKNNWSKQKDKTMHKRSIDIELEEFERHTPEGISSFNKSFASGTLGPGGIVLSNQSLFPSSRRE